MNSIGQKDFFLIPKLYIYIYTYIYIGKCNKYSMIEKDDYANRSSSGIVPFVI